MELDMVKAFEGLISSLTHEQGIDYKAKELVISRDTVSY